MAFVWVAADPCSTLAAVGAAGPEEPIAAVHSVPNRRVNFETEPCSSRSCLFDRKCGFQDGWLRESKLRLIVGRSGEMDGSRNVEPSDSAIVCVNLRGWTCVVGLEA